MLGMSTSTFAPIMQFKGELSASYVLTNGCDSLRTYLDYDYYTLYFFRPRIHHVPFHV